MLTSILTHALAVILGVIVMACAAAAGRGDQYSELIWRDMQITKLKERIVLLEAGRSVGPCSAQGGCDCLPDIDEDVGEGYAGWV